MIRDARIEDMDQILVLCERFFNATEYAELMQFSEEAMTKTITGLINDDSGILIVLDNLKGMAGALLYPFYMSGEITGQELFWWCEEKGKGLELLNALELEAIGRGAKSFMMISLDSLGPERLDKIYLKKGYNRSEHTYIRGF